MERSPILGKGAVIAISVMVVGATVTAFLPGTLHLLPSIVTMEGEHERKASPGRIMQVLESRASKTDGRLPAFDSSSLPDWWNEYSANWRPDPANRYVLAKPYVGMPIERYQAKNGPKASDMFDIFPVVSR